LTDVLRRSQRSELRCCSPSVEKRMRAEITRALRTQDTLGGIFEVLATGVPIGLGSYVHHTRKLDARLAQALMSIQSVKAVEVGRGVRAGMLRGSQMHDELFYAAARGYFRRTNNAGGIEGGMSNGSDIIIRATMKPIATIRKPLRSINLRTRKEERASFERSDVCAVPAGSVIGEAAVAFELTRALLEKCGGDSRKEFLRNYRGYLKQIG